MRSMQPVMAQLAVASVVLILGSGHLAGQRSPEDLDKARIAGIADLKSSSAETRRAAATQLGKIPQMMKAPPRMPDAVAALIEALKDSDPAVRASAAEALGWVGGTRFGGEEEDRAAAAKAEVPAIHSLLNDPTPAVRVKAVNALVMIERDAKAAALAVARMTKDPAASVRTAAVLGVRHIPLPRGPEAFRLVVPVLKDADADVRIAAIDALVWIGRQKDGVMPALTGMLRDPEPRVQRAAASQLTSQAVFDPNRPDPAVSAVPTLMELARDKDYPSRAAVVAALGRIGPDADVAVPVLTAALKDTDARLAAAGAILQYGAKAKAAVPALRELAKAGVGAEGGAVAAALLRIDPDAEESWAAFRGLGAGRRSVARTLLQIDREGKDEATLKVLTSLLKDEDPKVKESGVLLLQSSRLGPAVRAAALPHLLEILKSGTVPPGEVADALRYLKGDAKAAVPDLLKALEREKDVEARDAIIHAVKQIDPEALKKVGKP